MHSASYTIFTILSLLVVVGCIAPTIWHIKHRNAAGTSLGIWIIVLNLTAFIGCIVWKDDAINRAPVWCDISVKLQIGGPFGVLFSCLSIAVYLAEVLSPGAVLITEADLIRRRRYEYLVCFGGPIFLMAAHYVYQSYRFALTPGFGCQPTYAVSWETILLFVIWSPLLSVLGTAVGLYIVYRSYLHRRNFQVVVESTSHAITAARFRRLAGLSLSYLVIYTPLSIYSASQLFTKAPLVPYDWTWFHNGIHLILYNPAGAPLTPADWSGIIAGLCVMVFFGFGVESWSIYRSILVKFKVLKPATLQPQMSTLPNSLSAQLHRLNLESQTPSDQRSVGSLPGETTGSFIREKGDVKIDVETLV